MISTRLAAILALLVLSGCGGMARTVGVFPDTMDDLGRKSEALRGEREPVQTEAPAR